jgi:hypothetical protein
MKLCGMLFAKHESKFGAGGEIRTHDHWPCRVSLAKAIGSPNLSGCATCLVISSRHGSRLEKVMQLCVDHCPFEHNLKGFGSELYVKT